MILDFSFYITVTFFSGKRKTPPCLYNGKYFPHFVVKGDEEYLGVCFADGAACDFDQAVEAIALPIYENVSYNKLTPYTTFFIVEGGSIVGEGIVNDIFPGVWPRLSSDLLSHKEG